MIQANVISNSQILFRYNPYTSPPAPKFCRDALCNHYTISSKIFNKLSDKKINVAYYIGSTLQRYVFRCILVKNYNYSLK